MDKNSYSDVLLNLINSNYDMQSSETEEYASNLRDVHKEFVKRNKELTRLLKDYITQRNSRVKVNKVFKIINFFLFVFLLIALTAMVIYVFVNVDYNKISVQTVAGVTSAAVTYLGSLLSIFKIMTKYLFPSDEEKDTIDMINVVLNNDTQVEKLISNEESNKNTSEFIDTLRGFKQLLNDGVLKDKEFDAIKASMLLNRFEIKSEKSDDK